MAMPLRASSSTRTSAEASTSTRRRKVMILEETIKKLLELRMHAMADALRELVSKPPGHGLSFEAPLRGQVDCEWRDRPTKVMARRLNAPQLGQNTSLADVRCELERRLDKAVVLRLS